VSECVVLIRKVVRVFLFGEGGHATGRDRDRVATDPAGPPGYHSQLTSVEREINPPSFGTSSSSLTTRSNFLPATVGETKI
jgi:hypothetical protein